MKTIRIQRTFQNDKQSLGVCTIYDEMYRPILSGISLERGWLNNQNNISCVPKGTYTVILEYSNKFKKELWELKNVPNRSECKFHAANYWYQLNGCISLGSRLLDLDKDGYYDISNSGNTMIAFHKALQGETRVDLIIM
jgi:hypothetical protein